MIALLAAAVSAMTPAPMWAGQEIAPRQDKRHEADLQRDREQGAKYAAEADKQLKPTKNQEYQDRVARIGAEIAGIANSTSIQVTWGDKRLNPFAYRFKVVEGKDVNAFSLPGGFIYVFEGLVKFAESDDELAGVLAHEVAHASERHLATLEREQSKLSNITLPLILISIFAGGGRAAGDAMFGSQLLSMAYGSGWSVNAEKAADFGGFQFIQKTKYNPTGMLTFIERLAREEKGRLRGGELGIFQTHPPSRERATALTDRMRAAQIPIQRSLVTTTFRTTVKKAQDGGVEAWFNGRRIYLFGGPDALKRAEEAAARLNAFFDQVPEMFDVTLDEPDLILGARQKLLRVTPEDAKASRQSVDDLAQNTVKAIKGSIYSLAFRVWDGRE